VTFALLGIVILGSLLFCVYCLVGYYERVSPLRAESATIAESILQKKVRLEDLERDVELLKEAQPSMELESVRIRRWIEQLKAQTERLQSLSKPALGEVERHIEAVRSGEEEALWSTRSCWSPSGWWFLSELSPRWP